MSSSIDDVYLDHQLQLRCQDLPTTEYDCNQAHHSPSLLNANNKHKLVPNRPLPRGDELQLQQMKLPLKLPQRRKFITLAEANSASYSLSYKSSLENSASLFEKRSSGLLDLALAEGKEVASAPEELPGMEESNEDEFQEAVEIMKTKKKLLVQLAEHHEATVDAQWKSLQRIESSFRESSNPARNCRFCGRDFPSGRALGGHMRVHGALLFADCTVEQERRSPAYELAETLGSASHASRGGVQMEKIKAGSLTSSSSNSQMDSREVRNQITSKLDRHHQEHEEEEQDEEGAERASRTVHLSSFDCSRSLVSKAGDELLGYGDASSHELLTGKRKSTSALYELRRNPKPNQRFFRDQEVGISNVIWPANSYMASSIATRRSRSPSPESATARSCSECGKVFLSWKALFGHMRCHPERDWRGIQPPERSLELDSAIRSSTSLKASCVEINSLAESIINRQQVAGSSVAHLANKEEPSAKAHMQDTPLNSKLLTKSEVSHPTKDCSLYPSAGEFPESEPKQQLKNMEEVDAITEHALRKSGKKKSMKRVADHYPQSSKDPKDDWCPSWLTHNKRSKRTRVSHLHSGSFTSETISSELRPSQHVSELEIQDDLIVANSLMMLSNAGGLMQHLEGSACRDLTETDHVKKQAAYAKKVLKNGSGSTIQAHVETYNGWERGDLDDDVDEPETKVSTFTEVEDVEYHGNVEVSNNAGVKYQCSTCKKCFNSHQALGGHRASHRKMKGCFAQTKNSAKDIQESNAHYVVTEDDQLGAEKERMWQEGAQGREVPLLQVHEERRNTCQLDATSIPSSKTKGKGHECSICHRVFASGQALGGHKRCHWNGDRFIADTASVASSNKQSSLDGSTCKDSPIRLAKEDAIDLNLPAPLDEDEDGEATFDMSAAQGALVQDEIMLPAAMAKRGDHANAVGNSCATSTKWNINESDEWKFEDLMGEKKGASNFLPSDTDIDARCRFDQRSPLWTQTAVGTIMPQVCMLQTLR